MSLTVTTHLNFRGDARAALAFYQSVFGGELTLVTYAQMGRDVAPEAVDQIMWGQVASAGGFKVMAFDILAPRPFDAGTNAFFVSVRGTSPQEVEAQWTALSDGATVLQPLGASPWSALYGMLTDRFGVTWIVDVEPAG